ncbi:MAG: iron ABC transporter permease [Gammaproteobacteria bacterium]|nr:iron ABC transporter permease [Gammaproteobacteria bacterium]
MATPLFVLALLAMIGDGESFQHIKQTVLADYIINTVLLTFFVAVLVLCIGVPLAWLLANCEFAGKRFFNWALVLPLAMPAYIVAYTYTDLLDYAGPVQVGLRQWFGWTSPQDYWFFEIRSIGGAAVMLALVLYPYVYLMTRASFLEQNANLTQAARMLGASPVKSFFKVSLPLARAAIFAGTALVLMETIADFATVNYFAVSTLTTAVYDTWLGHYDLASAAKLSCLMVLGVLSLLMLEHAQNRNKGTSNDAKSSVLEINYRLTGWKNWAAFSFCGLVLLLAFLIPALQLALYAVNYFDQIWSSELATFAKNSFVIAVITAFVAFSLALLLSHNQRMKSHAWQSGSLKLASTGYAIPGTVLAIGVLIPLTFLDNWVNDLMVYAGYSPLGLVFSGTVFAIICTHLVRFTAIANKSLEASYQKISPSLDMAAKTLGTSERKLMWRIHLPLIKRSGLVAALLIFVESMKELPAALLLRPFDFHTLPTYVFQFASDEQLELASLGAIMIVLVGLVPLIFINRSIDHQ